ncbi:MAG: PTS lactose/cellobiose transporter subunit IIA [Clostridium sp.]|uniref:PTS lactose/cellobiose transporter subunit IIA n=1 Tax=Clostridium sp. TaxID=1506 RepID=UPI003D6CDC2A
MDDNMEEQIFELISHGGDAKGYAYEALTAAKENKMEKAEKLLNKSQKELDIAHTTQTKLIQAELNGEDLKISLLMIHAEDHLMAAISEKNLIKEMIDIIKLIHAK